MIIVFTGNIGSGKTTATNILKEKFNFFELSFAQPIKEFALAIGFNYNDVYGTQEEKNKINPDFGISGRQFMQRFGTDVMQNHASLIFPNVNSSSIWPFILEIKLKQLISEHKNIVISDCRFLNEAKLLKQYGAIIIKITRNTNLQSSHISELELHSIKEDICYENNKSIDDLQNFLSLFVHSKYDMYKFLKYAYYEND